MTISKLIARSVPATMVLALAGCASLYVPHYGGALYRCPDGRHFSARFDAADDSVFLRLREGDVKLRRIPAGSGAKYGDGRVEFWNKDQQATVQINGTAVYRGCVRG